MSGVVENLPVHYYGHECRSCGANFTNRFRHSEFCDPCEVEEREAMRRQKKPTLKWELTDWVFDGEEEVEEGVTITATKHGLDTQYGTILWNEIEAAREYFKGQESE